MAANSDAPWNALLGELEKAGIDTTDFGRFVNRVVPGVIEPAYFDEERATPHLLKWLPAIADPSHKETVVRHLKNPAARGIAVDLLIEEFRHAPDDLRWVIADTLQYIVTPKQHDAIVELAATHRYGASRQMLVDMLWRVKTDRAREVIIDSLKDPTVVLHASSALRRSVGNKQAITHLEPLARDADPRIARAAATHLKRAREAASKQS